MIDLPNLPRVLYCYQSSLDEMFNKISKMKYQGKNKKNERVYNGKSDMAYVLWSIERGKIDQIILQNKKTNIRRIYVSKEIQGA